MRARNPLGVYTYHLGMAPTDREDPLWRECPKCGAIPGERCVRWVGGRCREEPEGNPYARPLKGFHDERRKDPERTDNDRTDPTS